MIDLPVRRLGYAIHSIFDMQFFKESLLIPVNSTLLGTWHTSSAIPASDLHHIVTCRMFLLLTEKGFVVDCETWKRTELKLTEHENLRKSDDTNIQNYNVFFDNM